MYTNKTIGIWGFGKVGIASAHFFRRHGADIIGMDAKSCTPEMSTLFKFIFPEDKKLDFFEQCDLILVSPGIDIRPYYKQIQSKLITELDLFYALWKKPIIAVTGSVGKTTITHLLGQLLAHSGIQIAVGGNIGTPMLDLLSSASEYDMALLEVSSFQLEYCRSFEPDIALWTNFAPNHLDRHTLEEYFQAKSKICEFQTTLQHAIVPDHVYEQLKTIMPHKKFRVMCQPDTSIDTILKNNDIAYQIQDTQLIKIADDKKTTIIDITTLPHTTFLSNWLSIAAVLDTLGYACHTLGHEAQALTMPDHRMEKMIVGTLTFYNDSKSTTIASTLAAVERLKEAMPILLLGGLGKGVDREPLIAQLRGKVKKIICFGKEQKLLVAHCKKYGIPATGYDTLDAAFTDCTTTLAPHDTVLLSPSGSSYDLFKDYEERGNYFKKLITSFKDTYCNRTPGNDSLQIIP